MSTVSSLETMSYPAPARSVAAMLRRRVTATPDAEAFRFPVDDRWSSVTWSQLWETVRVTAAGLLSLGVQPEDRVAIASTTRIEWIYADLAIMCAGGATTAVYPATRPEDVTFILADSGTRIVFAEDDLQVAKLRAQRDHLPDVLRVVTFDGAADGEWVLNLGDLQALGAKLLAADPDLIDRTLNAVEPDQLATLVYTSGTTGRPKGVELPHRCWTYIGAAADALDLLSAEDLQYLWLPMSHAFGKMLLAVQLQIGFTTAIDGRMDRIIDNLAVVRPTFMAGPPRIFEKVHAKVVQTVQEEGGLRLQLFNWAFGVGSRTAQARQQGRAPSIALLAESLLADRLVLSKIRARLGGRIRFLLSGSAALSQDVAAWFAAAGLVIIEGYGLTETAAGACIGSLGSPSLGAVGPPVPGAEIKIASDGEILVRGPMVMRGYHNLPDATAEVLSSSGWLATGDVGELDASGRLRVTDRKRDLIKTSGGKYIAPQGIEVMFKAICPLASQMLVHGEGRNYATALIALDPDALAQWGRAQRLATSDYHQLVDDPAVQDYVRTCVDELNSRLNRWETIKDFRVLHDDLTPDNDGLTPSMKMKRKVVENRFWSLIESMYESHTDLRSPRT